MSDRSDAAAGQAGQQGGAGAQGDSEAGAAAGGGGYSGVPGSIPGSGSGGPLTPAEQVALVKALDVVKGFIEREHQPDGYNIGVNSGEAAGQTVLHLHVHLIPRYLGDSDDPRGGVRNMIPDRAKYW